MCNTGEACRTYGEEESRILVFGGQPEKKEQFGNPETQTG
jgi:hypothetical protein